MNIDAITACRRTMLAQVQRCNGMSPDTDLLSARIRRDGAQWCPGWTIDAVTGTPVALRADGDDDHAGWKSVGNAPAVTNIYRGPALQTLVDAIFAVGSTSSSVELLPQVSCE
jgi:hypothetical protein